MYKEDSTFEPPDNLAQKIWRYTDLAKFLLLIDKQALFFANAGIFEDPYDQSAVLNWFSTSFAFLIVGVFSSVFPSLTTYFNILVAYVLSSEDNDPAFSFSSI